MFDDTALAPFFSFLGASVSCSKRVSASVAAVMTARDFPPYAYNVLSAVTLLPSAMLAVRSVTDSLRVSLSLDIFNNFFVIQTLMFS